jgi:antitoxin (DNA-binding transcriptional repressor) of toxin-antitoxin stability system
MSPKTFDIAYLSDNLPDLVSDIQNHVEVTLTLQGVPFARVLPLTQASPTVINTSLNSASIESSSNFNKPSEVLKSRVAGFWQGQVKIADDFDDTSEEIIAAFYDVPLLIISG